MRLIAVSNARIRLSSALLLAERHVDSTDRTSRDLARAFIAVYPVALEACVATDSDGTLPGSLCNAVVKYGTPEKDRK